MKPGSGPRPVTDAFPHLIAYSRILMLPFSLYRSSSLNFSSLNHLALLPEHHVSRIFSQKPTA